MAEKTLKDLLTVKKKIEGEDEVRGVKALLGEKEKQLDEFIEKTKDQMDVGNWLKKASKHELENDYRKAIEAYLNFMEAKLEAINKDPHSTIQDYLLLVKYYLKIAECYEKVTHTSAGGKKIDMENAGKYYNICAQHYIDLNKPDEAFKCYEKAARCYAEVESYINAAQTYMDAAAMQYSLDKKMMACTCINKAADFYEKGGDYLNASKAYLKAAEINQNIKDLYGAINAYKKAGECYDKMGNPKEAIQYYIQSAELSSTVDRYNEIADRYSGIAKSYEKLEDWSSAIFYHLRAADINKGNDDLASSYNLENAAKCYEKSGYPQKALEYYRKSLEIRINLKKFGEAAQTAYNMADVYEKTGDLENAANMYFQHGEYATSANQKNPEGYKKSALLRRKIAEKKAEENKKEEAIKNYIEAAKSLDRLDDKKSAADIYMLLGNMEAETNYDSSVKHYTEAANRYMAVGENINAAKGFLLAKDYINAAKNFIAYANTQLGKGQFFYAADGYRRAADTYSKLKKQADSRNAYSKAIHNYQQYLERAQYLKTDNAEINIGNANRKIGECYMELEESPTAKKFLEKALSYYKENKMEKEARLTDALIGMVDVDLAFKVGEYEKGRELLNKTLEVIDKIIENKELSEDYNEFLQRNKEKVRELIGRLEIKPEVDLIVEEPTQRYQPGNTVLIKAQITNKSKYPIKNLYFITTLPQELKPIKEPQAIDELKENEGREVVIEAEAQAPGKFSFSPLEMLYKDKNGNKYMKASNEIIVEINEPPQEK